MLSKTFVLFIYFHYSLSKKGLMRKLKDPEPEVVLGLDPSGAGLLFSFVTTVFSLLNSDLVISPKGS